MTRENEQCPECGSEHYSVHYEESVTQKHIHRDGIMTRTETLASAGEPLTHLETVCENCGHEWDRSLEIQTYMHGPERRLIRTILKDHDVEPSEGLVEELAAIVGSQVTENYEKLKDRDPDAARSWCNAQGVDPR